MAHFAILSPDDAGGTLPICTVGHELVRRGHRLTIVAGTASAPLAQLTGLPLHPLPVDQLARPRHPLLWLALRPFGLNWIAAVRGMFELYARAHLYHLPPALQALQVDGALIHQNIVAGGTACERVGVPFVSICSPLVWNEELNVPPQFTGWGQATTRGERWRNRAGYAAWHWFVRPMLRTINRQRRAWHLPALANMADAYSPLAQISQLCPEFDFPRRQLPPQFHYIGSFGAQRKEAAERPFPWDRLDGRPLIFGSLGTVNHSTNVRAFRKILAACAGLDVQLVLALGKWRSQAGPSVGDLGPLPDNAIVVEFAPQLAVLDRAALLITHAGVNTVLEAVCRGVPIVALPRGSDQLGMGARVLHAGVGLRASYRHFTPTELRGLVQRVLSDDGIRRRTQQLGQAVLAAGGVTRAADIAEQALLTRRPVLRT